MVVYRFRCLLCGLTKELKYGRRSSSGRHTAIMLASLVVYRELDAQFAKSVYSDIMLTRRRLCTDHFAEAAKCIFADIGAFADDSSDADLDKDWILTNDGNIPGPAMERICAAVKQLCEKSALTAANIGSFLNDSLTRYGSGIIPDKEYSSSLRSSQSFMAPPVLEETDSQLLDEIFHVQGRKLLELFRYCPSCGTSLDESNGGSVRLLAKEKTPFVDLICRKCWSARSAQMRWEGIPGVMCEHEAQANVKEESWEADSGQQQLDFVEDSSLIDNESGYEACSSNTKGGGENLVSHEPKCLNELSLIDCEQSRNRVLMRFRCVLCGGVRDLEHGRRSSSSHYLSAVLISSLMFFKSFDLVEARAAYIACKNKRKLLCRRHFAEVRKCLATEIVSSGGKLPHSDGELNSARATDFEIPPQLLDSLNTCAQKLESDLILKPCNVALFLYNGLSRNDSESHEDDETPVEKPTDTAAINYCNESSSQKSPDLELQRKLWPVEGRKLLELFSFCMVCGTSIEKANGSSVRLTAKGQVPVVEVLCGMCWISKRPQQRWEGQSSDAFEEKMRIEEAESNAVAMPKRNGDKLGRSVGHENGEHFEVTEGTPDGNAIDGAHNKHRAQHPIERPESKVMLRYRCVFCSLTCPLSLGRMSFSSHILSAVMLSSLMVFNSMSVDSAKAVYLACKDKRKMMCKVHYAEAAKYIVAELSATIGTFPRFVEGVGSIFKKDSDVPDHLLDCLNNSVKTFSGSIIVTARDVGHFLNGNLVRYYENSNPDKNMCSNWPADLPMASQCEYDLSMSEAPPTLSETSPELLDEIFMVESKKLFLLFRHCPVCGTAVDRKTGGSVRLLVMGTTPIVDVACGVCWISRTTQRRWKGLSESKGEKGVRKRTRDEHSCLKHSHNYEAKSERCYWNENLASQETTQDFLCHIEDLKPFEGQSTSYDKPKESRISPLNKSKILLRYRCVLCGYTRDLCFGRMSSSSRQLTGVLLTSLMFFKSMGLDRARMVYHVCLKKRKMLCKKHYREAATCIASEVAAAAGGLSNLCGNEGKLRDFEIPSDILDCLNACARHIDETLLLTTANVAHFVDGSFSPSDDIDESEVADVEYDNNITSKRSRMDEEVTQNREQESARGTVCVDGIEGGEFPCEDLFSVHDIKVEE